MNGDRLEAPEYCNEEVFEIMKKCWKENRESRPDFDFFMTSFREIFQANS